MGGSTCSGIIFPASPFLIYEGVSIRQNDRYLKSSIQGGQLSPEYPIHGYFGGTMPLISVKQCHFKRYCNYIKN